MATHEHEIADLLRRTGWECREPNGTPPPGGGGATLRGVFAERKQFLWAVTRSTDDYARRMSVINASWPRETQWVVRGWGFHRERFLAAAPSSGVDVIGGAPIFPAKLVVGYQTGATRAEIVVDVSGDLVLNVPPTRNLTIDALLPANSANVQVQSPFALSDSALAGQATYIDGQIQIAAWPTDCPIERGHPRQTLSRSIEAGAAAFTVPIPIGATSLRIYQSAPIVGGAAPSLACQWCTSDDTAAGLVIPFGDITIGTDEVVPGEAVAVRVESDPVNNARAVFVFGLE